MCGGLELWMDMPSTLQMVKDAHSTTDKLHTKRLQQLQNTVRIGHPICPGQTDARDGTLRVKLFYTWLDDCSSQTIPVVFYEPVAALKRLCSGLCFAGAALNRRGRRRRAAIRRRTGNTQTQKTNFQ